MKDHFAVIETIRITYMASKNGDDAFINCFICCMEIRKHCNAYLKAGGVYKELEDIFISVDRTVKKQ